MEFREEVRAAVRRASAGSGGGAALDRFFADASLDWTKIDDPILRLVELWYRSASQSTHQYWAYVHASAFHAGPHTPSDHDIAEYVRRPLDQEGVLEDSLDAVFLALSVYVSRADQETATSLIRAMDDYVEAEFAVLKKNRDYLLFIHLSNWLLPDRQ
ncbi:MAG: hypothetical protein JNK05_24690 [Myxococcales bacterium]|nr:hypothetical protein [Myxococcales bacterium]